MKENLPTSLYTCEQVRALDRCAIEQHKIPGIVLMKRAGRASFELAQNRWPQRPLLVLCGGGNNGGDGYVIAALAAAKNIPVLIRYLVEPEKLKGDAQTAYQFAVQEGVDIAAFDETESLDEKSLIVDAMLGSGLNGNVREPFNATIEWVNSIDMPVLSIDIPSGLCGDTGAVLGAAVKADATICFIGLKQGLITAAAPAYVGELEFDDLQVPEEVYHFEAPSIQRICLSQFPALPSRPQDAHKALFGHVMVLGGDIGFGGASIMAAESALATGTGLVSLATQPEHVAPALVRRPELMAMGIKSGQNLEPVLDRATVLVVGPGLGRSSWSEQFLQKAFDTDKPLVLDADGLNILAERLGERDQRGNWVLTPHPGEAARLLGVSTSEVQADRFACVKALHQRYGGVIVLKGAGTLIASDEGIYLAKVGNPAMATAGSGDILSGIIGGLIAQGLSLLQAAQLGVCLHGKAGDLAAEGQANIYASEMIPAVRQVLVDVE